MIHAIVLAGGKGTRMNSEHDEIPKPLRLALGKPLISYVLENIEFIPPQNTLIVIGAMREKILDALEGRGYQFVIQEEPLGTGHAVMVTEPHIPKDDPDANVLVCFGDMPMISRTTFENIIEHHRRTGADLTTLTAAVDPPPAYGRILRDDQGALSGIVEQRDCTPAQLNICEVHVGINVYKASKLYEYIKKLDNDNRNREYYLTKVPELMLRDGLNVQTMLAQDTREIYGVNTAEDLRLVEAILSERRYQRIRFGTGGWRAIIGEDFTRQNVMRLAQGVAEYAKQIGADEKGVALAYDRRFLAEQAAQWIVGVMAVNNIPVHLIEQPAPTPELMLAVWKMGLKLGMMITASHNPFNYNGIKVMTEGGRDATEEITAQIERLVDRGSSFPPSIPFEQAQQAGLVRPIDPYQRYIENIYTILDPEVIRRAPRRIALDPMHGVAAKAICDILRGAGCTVDVIHGQRDAFFGGRLPSPSKATLGELYDKVIGGGYDLGIASDGDADRLGIIDSNGKFITANEVMALLYYYLIRYRNMKGPIVRNLCTTHLLDAMAADFGEACYEVPVGFKYVSSKMDQTDALLGGESSGGLTLRGHIHGKDGIFAAVLLVEMLCGTNRPLSQSVDMLYEAYGHRVFNEKSYPFEQKRKPALERMLFEEKRLPQFPMKALGATYVDGVKVRFEGGAWLVARFSGTEPLVRIAVEAPDQALCDALCEALASFLEL